MADVFLSYARADAAAADRVARLIAKAGWSVWYDRELPAHRAYADVIAKELESAAAVLVLWSKSATASEWVRSEANRARELQKLVQARIDDCRLPMPFDQTQCADLRKWGGADAHTGRSQVRKSIEALVARPPAEQITADFSRDRRKLLLGGAAIAGAAAAGVAVWRTSSGKDALSPQAQLLVQKGFDALQENDALDPAGSGSTMEAIALLTQASQAAPHSASVWGALSLAYAVRKRTVPLAEKPGLDMRSRAAARRALELEPGEPRALGALLLLNPVYKHWIETERADRAAVRTNSSIPLLLSITSDMLGNVGRWSDALGFSKRIDRTHFLIPGADRRFIVDLWAAGEIQEADNALETAVARWPEQAEIWRMRLSYLMYSGRAGEAVDLLRDGAERPAEIRDDFVTAMRAAAEALAGMRQTSSAINAAQDYLRKNPAEALRLANACSALGVLDAAFEILEGYYFGSGQWAQVAPQGGDQDRITNALFLPPMKAVWGDRRFDRLLQRIGLEEYWRLSRTTPDFRTKFART